MAYFREVLFTFLRSMLLLRNGGHALSYFFPEVKKGCVGMGSQVSDLVLTLSYPSADEPNLAFLDRAGWIKCQCFGFLECERQDKISVLCSEPVF